MAKKLFILLSLFCFLLFFGISPALAAEDMEDEDRDIPRFMMDEIVVTASRDFEQIVNIPANVTVITADDIEKSISCTLTDLLAAEGGLVQRGFFGNDKKSGVDIRGMGETSVSSVLVMVDGVRINPADMAGPDLSTLALDQVERIEIVRGSGSVLYGNGAVGGVINIITKSEGGKPGGLVRLERGSFGSEKATVQVKASLDDFHLALIGNYSDEDGYRENGRLRNQNFEAKAAYDIGSRLSLSGKMRYHKDHYGFPGPLTVEQFEDDPRQSLDDTGSDGDTCEKVYSAGLDGFFGDFGDFSARVTRGDRENTWVMLYTPGEIHERSWDVNLKHKWGRNFGSYVMSELILGIDYRQVEYYQVTSFSTKPYDLDSIGYYFLEKLILFDNWIVQAGYRYTDFEYEIRKTDAGDTWRSNDLTIGVVRRFDFGGLLSGSLFANYATSFRVPDVDELGFATDGIRPQDGEHWDVGGKFQFLKRAELMLTWFNTHIEDEIWFDALNYINTNYDYPTKRTGLETSFRVYLLDSLSFWGSHTYTKARFEGVDYKVPTVPRHKFVAGVNWEPTGWLALGATYNRVGSRPQGGNPIIGDRYKDMPSYQVVNFKVTGNLEKYNLSMFFAVNNVFAEQYYSLSYYDNVYPSPGRSFRGGLTWKF
jgi:iron complex outermembrane receptor protein